MATTLAPASSSIVDTTQGGGSSKPSPAQSFSEIDELEAMEEGPSNEETPINHTASSSAPLESLQRGSAAEGSRNPPGISAKDPSSSGGQDPKPISILRRKGFWGSLLVSNMVTALIVAGVAWGVAWGPGNEPRGGQGRAADGAPKTVTLAGNVSAPKNATVRGGHTLPVSVQSNGTISYVYEMPHIFTSQGQNFSVDQLTGDLAYVHMGMAAVMPNGSLAAVWQASLLPGEGAPEQTFYWAVSQDDGATWGPASPFVPVIWNNDGVRMPIWSPVLHVEDGRMYIFYSISVDVCKFFKRDRYGLTRWGVAGDAYLRYSDDNGQSWSQPQLVYPFRAEGGISKVLANRLHLAGNGDWLLPFWREDDPSDTPYSCNLQHMRYNGVPAILISSDKGKTWNVSADVVRAPDTPGTWLIENAIAPIGGPNSTRMLQVFRTYQNIPMFSSVSSDNGRTWSPAIPMELPNPNSKVHMIALPTGELLLAYNDHPQLRTPLSLAMSLDGVSWTKLEDVEDHPDAQFSYPTLLHVPKTDRILLIYTTLFYPDKWTGTGSPPGSGMRAHSTDAGRLRAAFHAAIKSNVVVTSPANPPSASPSSNATAG